MNARLFIKRNSATILSFVAVAGVVATAITSANATPKAVRALDTAKLNKGEEELTKIEKVKTVLPVYLPTIITGEGEGRVYESDEYPLDLYSPVEGKIEIKLSW